MSSSSPGQVTTCVALNQLTQLETLGSPATHLRVVEGDDALVLARPGEVFLDHGGKLEGQARLDESRWARSDGRANCQHPCEASTSMMSIIIFVVKIFDCD